MSLYDLRRRRSTGMNTGFELLDSGGTLKIRGGNVSCCLISTMKGFRPLSLMLGAEALAMALNKSDEHVEVIPGKLQNACLNFSAN